MKYLKKWLKENGYVFYETVLLNEKMLIVSKGIHHTTIPVREIKGAPLEYLCLEIEFSIKKLIERHEKNE